jgi:hypothetical protein
MTTESKSGSLFPQNPAARKTYPIATGVLDYFPAALREVAYVSFVGNQQHNPGQPLHWSRGKSTDQADTQLRHKMESYNSDGTLARDTDGTFHKAKEVWRALAELQIALEKEGAPLARGARLPEEK